MIRCMIVDDKPLALELLEEYISKIDFLQLVHKTTNPLEAMTWIRQKKIDLVFLDIQMPELSGMDFIALTKNQCKIILITAYPDYALKGYEYDVVDYLLKPVSFERFYKAALKVQELNNINALQQAKTNEDNSQLLFVRTDHKIKSIQRSSILFVEGMQNYVAIHTITEKIITLQPLKFIEKKLASPDFLRVHKSYIIALDKIDVIENNCVTIHKKVIPIGHTYKEKFYKRISLE